eukprot:gene4684-biopygen7479
MLYVGWRVREQGGVKQMKFISDSKTNVDGTNKVKDGGSVAKADITPTRTWRTAELLARSKGELKWIRGHQEKNGDEEVEVNKRADKEATRARKDGI